MELVSTPRNTMTKYPILQSSLHSTIRSANSMAFWVVNSGGTETGTKPL